jgi:two-component system response regulator NreC
MHDDEQLVTRCVEAGATGYVMKDAPAEELVEAIVTVYQGEQYFSPGVLEKVSVSREGQRSANGYESLSAREKEILKLLAEGLSVKEIAVRLNRSVKTVDVHKYNLMRKIDVHDRAGLIRYAIRKRLIVVPIAEPT